MSSAEKDGYNFESNVLEGSHQEDPRKHAFQVKRKERLNKGAEVCEPRVWREESTVSSALP